VVNSRRLARGTILNQERRELRERYYALLQELSFLEDSLNVPREARAIQLFETNPDEYEEETPQYGLAMRILLRIKDLFQNGLKRAES